MEVKIFHNGAAAGMAEVRSDGLYWDISCRVEVQGLVRLYGIGGWNSEYLGIPGADGRLRAHMGKKHLPDGLSAIVASAAPRGDWSPWMGTVDGVAVAEGYLQPRSDGFLLALSADESVKFPEWVDQMEQIQVYGRNMAQLRLDSEGRLSLIETESRGTEDEEIDRGDSSFGMPGDIDSNDGIGAGAAGGEEDRG